MNNNTAQPGTAAPIQHTTTPGNGANAAIAPAGPPRMNAELAFMMALEPANLDQALMVAELLAEHKLFGIKSKADGLARMMTGRGLMLPLYASLNGIYSTDDGKIGMYAKLKVSMCLKHPDCEYFEFEERSSEQSIWVTKRRGRPEKRIKFTYKEAEDAGLVGRGEDDKGQKGNNWNRWKADMLSARASGRLADLVYPDVMMGFPSMEDLEDGNVIETTGEPVVETQAAQPQQPKQAAPTRDFAAEAAALKADMTAAASQPEEAKKSVRAKLSKFINEPGSEPYRNDVGQHYRKTVAPTAAPTQPATSGGLSGPAAQSNVEPTLFTSAPAAGK